MLSLQEHQRMSHLQWLQIKKHILKMAYLDQQSPSFMVWVGERETGPHASSTCGCGLSSLPLAWPDFQIGHGLVVACSPWVGTPDLDQCFSNSGALRCQHGKFWELKSLHLKAAEIDLEYSSLWHTLHIMKSIVVSFVVS